jgi:hypothetical protein
MMAGLMSVQRFFRPDGGGQERDLARSVEGAQHRLDEIDCARHEHRDLMARVKGDIERLDAETKALDAEAADLAIPAFKGAEAARVRLDAIEARRQVMAKERARAESAAGRATSDLGVLDEQYGVAHEALLDARLKVADAHLQARADRTDHAAEQFTHELEAFIAADNAATAAAGLAREPQGSLLSDRLVFALSRHLLTPTVLKALGSTSLELRVAYARHRDGLTFQRIARRPFSQATEQEEQTNV